MSFYSILGLLIIHLGFISNLSFSSENEQSLFGKSVIQKMTGCFLIDYSYTETESLKADYTLDPRVYDVNKKNSFKEWIYLENISSNELRLQHILFLTDKNGVYQDQSILKHQAEDWEFNAPYAYDFVGPLHWVVKKLNAPEFQNKWTRKITNLDDGLRYQCTAGWDTTSFYPEWTCENYAPIPGRETRDMGRKDYQTLQRTTRIVHYGSNWLERQDNIKTIHQAAVKTPLAREVGKNWYIRLPDSECQVAQEYAAEKSAFWHLLRETWKEVLQGDRDFIEKIPSGQKARFFKIFDIEDQYSKADLSDAALRSTVKNKILKVIEEYRVP